MMGTAAFTVSLWLSTTATSDSLPALVSDKPWDTGQIVDVTSHHDLGVTRDSGVEPGWAIALDPHGAWVWNAGDGEARVDYRPPIPAGYIADGEWHLLAFSVDQNAAEARLYLDGANVAIFSLAGLGTIRGPSPAVVTEQIGGESVQVKDLCIEDGVVGIEQIRQRWQNRGGPDRGEQAIAEGLASEPVRHLRVMAWNIWHGGRRDGDQDGLTATIAAIQAAGADVVAMQETYGSGAHIAAGLGYSYYLRSSNLSIMSRYPIRATHDLYEPFRLGGVTLELSPGQHLKLFSLWIHYLLDYGSRMKDLADPLTTASLVEEEMQTRGREIEEILALLRSHIDHSDRVPVIVAGDFNSPSHLDWGPDTAAEHRDLVVDWPVSRSMAAAGFVDAFRAVHPDPVQKPGRTWSPRFTEAWKDRIDFVYLHGPKLTPCAAAVHDQQDPRWPSDHAAVVVDVDLDFVTVQTGESERGPSSASEE
ncbi:MAG: hypothetical protein HN712_06180 [Gemmatimonadetes bacterium]|nr:hypothetical protein [Gemmatimonadota bacterium]